MFGAKKKRVQELEDALASIGGLELVQIKAEAEAAQVVLERIRAQQAREFADFNSRRAAQERELAEVSARVVHLANEVELQDLGLYTFEHPANSSVALGDELKNLRRRIREMAKAGQATQASNSFTFNDSAAQGRKFVKQMSTLSLNAYNAEAENCVKSVRAGGEKTAADRLERMAKRIERNGSMINLRITYQYRQLREEEIRLAARHLAAVKAAKEAEREERARLREEHKAQQELQKERARLEKELQHYTNALARLEDIDSDEGQRMQKHMAEIQKGIENVDYRAANIRAGYVYVISNIGSFGPEVVKIGMTRRLEPMDRVKELSGASVPFNFDVHALFFSEDAVGVEAELHRRFANERVNKINLRREYFRTTPAQVRNVLGEIAGSLLEFHEEPEADQYHLSQEAQEKH